MSGYGVPDLSTLRVHLYLSTLALTEPGDVFYLVSDPSAVWHRHARSGADAHDFRRMGHEVWFTQSGVGDGTPGQRVVVLHSTRTYGAWR